MMHEFGLYPRAWTREMREKPFRPSRGEFGLKPLFPEAGKKRRKKKDARVSKEDKMSKELQKLYRAMGV